VMKWVLVVMSVVLIVLSIFTTLYFTKPRTIETERLIEAIPDTIRVQMPSSPPDVVVDTVYIEKLVDNTTMQIPCLYSQKTFKKTLLGDNGSPLATVKSKVGVFSECEVLSMDNDIEIGLFRESIASEIASKMPGDKQAGFTKGLIIGGGVTLGITAITLAITRL